MPSSDDGTAVAPLSPRVRAFLTAPHFLALASVDPDGAPRQALIWYDLDGDDLLVNSRTDRRWPRNLRRDGRVALAIFDATNPLRWVGIRAVVRSIDDDPERALGDIQALARRYHPADPARQLQFAGQSRVTFRLEIREVHEHLD
ncbi:MAG TPA: TIGR03618 family F420-dependent PPOX class oxidoreductase [Candidatus Limnocylindrales bacterium]|nr:TIGR03618 family F420-dependent PPOX class oxidoreductase [Candidatus Limnocylindrales bacterium]